MVINDSYWRNWEAVLSVLQSLKHKFLIVLYSIAFLIIITGCVATPYKEREGYYGGYSSTQLQKNVFRVHFKGNAYTTQNRTKDLALLRAAEITTENGYKYFHVLNRKHPLKLKRGTNYYSDNNLDTNLIGNTSSYSEIFIECYNKEPKKKFVFDAKELEKRLKKKYKIN